MSSYKAALGLILLSPLLGVRDSTTSSRQATNNPTNDTFSSFRWIDSQKDAPLWAKVQAAFHEPLKPDPPDEAPPYGYKYISRIGVSNNSALVIIGHRIKKRELPGEYFLAFNYDLLTGATSEVINPERDETVALYMYQWKFIRLARFDTSPNPDVVFTYRNCWECEDELILAALQYDAASQKWQVRSWGDRDVRWWMTRVGLVVDKDMAFTEVRSYQCLYGLFKLSGGGLDDVAIRCRQVNDDGQKQDSLVLYSSKNGNFIGEVVTTKDQQLKILSALCRNSRQRKKLCREVEPSKISREEGKAALQGND